MNPTAVLLHQSVWTLLASCIIEYAKNAKWFPLLTAKTATLNRWAGVLASGLAAFGVHLAFAHPAAGVYSYTFTGLTAAGIFAGAQEWIRTFLTQEVMYQNLIRGKIGMPSNGAAGSGTLPVPTSSTPAAPNTTAVPTPPVVPAPLH